MRPAAIVAALLAALAAATPAAAGFVAQNGLLVEGRLRVVNPFA